MALRLLLIGAGHAQLEVLRRLGREPLPGIEATLVSGERHVYSGMVPGYLQGTYTEEEISFPVPALAARAGVRFVAGRAVALDPARRSVRLESGGELAYDLVAFAVGSNTAGIDRPEVGAHAQPVKPFERVAGLNARLRELARRPGERRAAAVGGGAAGVEVALAMAAVLARAEGPFRVTLLEAGPEILAGYSARFRRRARAVLARRGIAVHTGVRVAAVGEDEVELEDGGTVLSDLTVWLTGAVAWPLFRGSGLPLDDRGFLWLDESLRSVADPRVFAAGDCGTLASHPETPKAGVYAVREGPVLYESLRAAALGREPPRYTPQEGFLSILNSADGRALLSWKAVASHSRWAWRLKDRIDRRFMARYRGGSSEPGSSA